MSRYGSRRGVAPVRRRPRGVVSRGGSVTAVAMTAAPFSGGRCEGFGGRFRWEAKRFANGVRYLEQEGR
ncbi:hypothetical protein GCM10010363_52830 [Streptomyces omiyaensis]|nr:hypothetical protein GCM10010363_52830 [Streptomyces omiyaensis]